MTVEEYAKAKAARKVRERYDRLVAANACVTCGAQDERTLSGRTRCAACYAKAYKNPQVVTEADLKRYAANRRAKRKQNEEKGLCRDCGAVDYSVLHGKKLCARCQRRRKGKNDRYHKSGKSAEWQKRRREQYKAEGLCSKCGKNPPEEGRLQCTDCLVRNRIYKMMARMKKVGREI